MDEELLASLMFGLLACLGQFANFFAGFFCNNQPTTMKAPTCTVFTITDVNGLLHRHQRPRRRISKRQRLRRQRRHVTPHAPAVSTDHVHAPFNSTQSLMHRAAQHCVGEILQTAQQMGIDQHGSFLPPPPTTTQPPVPAAIRA